MHSIKLFFLCFVFALQSQAQCLENPTFETTITQSYQASDAFTANKVPHWEKGRRSPTIFSYATNPFAWMWSKNHVIESIVAEYPFETGKTYTVTFDIRTDDDDGNSSVFSFDVARYASANVYAINKAESASVPSSTSWWADPIWTYHWSAGQSKWFSDFSGSSWHTVSVSFTAPNDRDAIMIFPHLGMRPRSGQAIMMVDNITIIGEPENEFHFQKDAAVNSTPTTSFTQGCDIWLNGMACTHEDRYHLNVRRIPSSGNGGYEWLGSLGWAEGELGIVNLTELCTQNNIIFEAGYIYEVNVATQNLPCMPWFDQWKSFSVTGSIGLVNTFKLTNEWSTVEQNTFSDRNCHDVILDASGSQNYTGYHIDGWRRQVGTNTWSVTGSMSWTTGLITGPINLTSEGLFGTNGLEYGYEYKVKFALQNTSSGASPCLGWIPREKTFNVQQCVSKRKEDAPSKTLHVLASNALTIYPNPSKGQFSVGFKKAFEGTFQIISLNGKVVLEGTIDKQKEIKVDLKDYVAGVYFVQVVSNKEVVTKKVVLE
ncbi:MAG: T9SS type A sorting domain-containing protein [Aureispira sp.]